MTTVRDVQLTQRASMRSASPSGGGLSLLLITLSALHFVLCLPGLHSGAPAGTVEHKVFSVALGSYTDGQIGNAGGAATKGLPAESHDDCGDSTALPSEGNRVVMLLIAAFLGLAVLSVRGERDTAAMFLRSLRTVLRRRCLSPSCLQGARLLNLICLARL